MATASATGEVSAPSGFLFSVIFLLLQAAITILIITGIVFIYMWVFVSWLHYDYVTVASVYFILTMIPTVLIYGAAIFFQENKVVGLFVAIYLIILSSIAILSGLGVYEAVCHPEMSDHINVVALYENIALAPLRWFGHMFAGLGGWANGLVNLLSAKDVANQAAGGLASTFITVASMRVIQMFGGKPVVAAAVAR